MSTVFRYTPSEGELSGNALIAQTEEAFNQLGDALDAARELAGDALDEADRAITLAYDALLAAQQALTDASIVRTAAAAAHDAARDAQEAADIATARVDQAYALAEDALDRAESVALDVAEAREAMEAAAAAVKAIREMIEAARTQAKLAGDRANEAMDLTESFENLFLVNIEPVNADHCFLVPEKLRLEHPECGGLPLRAPCYLVVETEDTGSVATQSVWNGESAWLRTAVLERSIHPGTEILALEYLPEEGEASRSSLALTARNGELDLAVADGAFTPDLSLPHRLTGEVRFPLAAHPYGHVSLGGGDLVLLAHDRAILLCDCIEFSAGRLEVDEVSLKDGALALRVTCHWTDAEAPVARWSPWLMQGKAGLLDVFYRDSRITDADHVCESVQLCLSGPECANLPVSGPVCLDVLVTDDGAAATQLAWSRERGGLWFRTGERSEDGGTKMRWSGWTSCEGPYDRGVIVPLEPAATVTLDLESPPSVSMDLVNDLVVTIEPLACEVDKVTALVLTAKDSVTIGWRASEGRVLWVGSQKVAALEWGQLAVVNVRRAGGQVLLSTVYCGDDPAYARREPLRLSVEASEAYGNSFTFTGLNQACCASDTVIDWGDGTFWSYADLPETGNTAHTFAEEGSFVVTLTTSSADFSLQSNVLLTSVEGNFPPAHSNPDGSYMFSSCANLVAVGGDIFKFRPKMSSAAFCFSYCRALEELPETLFSYTRHISSFEECFSWCDSLKSVPEGLFANMSRARNFTRCFCNCKGLERIGKNAFSGLPVAETFYQCFYVCENLAELPERLFSDLPQAVTFESCFSYCKSLEQVPARIFDNLPAAENFSSCFSYCDSLRQVAEDVFGSLPEAVTFTMCFYQCSGLEAIPARLFSRTPKAASFGMCFSRCAALASVPEGLFDLQAEALDFSGCFDGCSGLTTLPETLFARTPLVTNMVGCFASCANLSLIPEQLFSGLPLVTSYQSCFLGCSRLVSVPETLFHAASEVTNFDFCFSGCEKLSAIPATLFDRSPKVLSFSTCFSGCVSLQAIPEELFANMTAAQDFSWCFSGCGSLKEIPASLFESLKNLKSVTSCFSDNTALTSAVPELWNKPGITSYAKCFSGCVNAANYDAIPESWK